MSKQLFTALILVLSQSFFSQLTAQIDTVTLTACLSASDQHLPYSSRVEAYQSLHSLQKNIIGSTWLPSLSLAASATYQSDVVTIPINLPNLEIPVPAKDQYGIYLEARQPVYDAGMTKARYEIEGVNQLLDITEVEASREQNHRVIADAFFSVLLVRQRLILLRTAGADLESTHQRMIALFEEGAAPRSSVLQIEAALSNYRQQLMEMEILETAALNVINLLTGIRADTGTTFDVGSFWNTPPKFMSAGTFNTAENKIFELRALQLDAGRALISNKRLPVMAAWGRAGYGRPGLNILSEEFNPYFIVGATLSWEPWDWQKSKKELEIVDFRKRDIEARHEFYLNSQEIKRQQLLSEIARFPEIIAEANEMVRIRTEIKESAAAALEEGAISVNDYVADFNDLIAAKQEVVMREIMHSKAIVNYVLLIGHSF